MTTSRVSAIMGAAIGLAALAAPTTGAVAADLNYTPSIKDYGPPPPTRTWYFKGYLGMHNYDSDDLWSELYDTNDFELHHQDYKSAPFFGIGIGAICNRWLRWDITGEYRGSSVFFAQDSYPGGPGFGAGTNEYTIDLESWVGLANAYIDVFTWRGLTPFVGAGIGFASVSLTGLKDINVPQNSVFYGSDNTETNFAWALHAGVSYQVTSNVNVDFGYRYLNLGDVATGSATAYDNSSSYSGVYLDDLHSHDLMLAMRWNLDHPAPTYAPIK